MVSPSFKSVFSMATYSTRAMVPEENTSSSRMMTASVLRE